MDCPPIEDLFLRVTIREDLDTFELAAEGAANLVFPSLHQICFSVKLGFASQKAEELFRVD